MLNNEKICVGVVTYNRKDNFLILLSQLKKIDYIDTIYVVKNKDVDYGEFSTEGFKYLNIKEDIGVGACKNVILKYALDNKIAHTFIIEDDLQIKDADVFKVYIKTAETFKLGHLNFGGNWDSTTNRMLKPYKTFQVDNVKLDIYTRLCGSFEYFTLETLTECGIFDEHYINALEHIDHTLNISEHKLYTPFHWFADIYNSSQYILPTETSKKSTVDLFSNKNSYLKNATEYFNKKHQFPISQLPSTTYNGLLEFFMDKIQPTKKYSVLTYIMGNYENVKEITTKDINAEYILVTDNPKIKSDTWKVVLDTNLSGDNFDKCWQVRYNPFKYCSTNVCIKMDGNIQIKKSLGILIDIFNQGGYDICLMPHPLRDTFAPEYEAWITQRHYPITQAQKFMNMIKSTNYDLSYKGLFQLTFSIQRKTKLTEDMNRMTYSLLKYLGTETNIERLDQTVFSYVINYYFNNIKILPVSEQILHNNPYMQWFWHGSNQPNNNIFYDPTLNTPDVKWVLNSQVKCVYLK